MSDTFMTDIFYYIGSCDLSVQTDITVAVLFGPGNPPGNHSKCNYCCYHSKRCLHKKIVGSIMCTIYCQVSYRLYIVYLAVFCH